MKKIVFLEFGKYSSFTKKMPNGLSLFENNVNQLKNFFGECIIDIFVLTHDEGESKKKTLINFCKNVNITLISIYYWENLVKFHDIDKERIENYKNTFKTFIRNQNYCPYGYDNNNKFNPGSLWFRKYIIFNLYNNYIINNKLKYHDIICITRLFSTKIIFLKKINFYFDNKLYFSPDTLFIGNFKIIKKLVEFGKLGLFDANKNKDNILNIKNDNKFMELSYNFDSNIASHYFCSEIQILYYIYKNFDKYENIRFNFPKYINKCDIVYNIFYQDDVYTDKKLIKSNIFENNNSKLFIKIYR